MADEAARSPMNEGVRFAGTSEGCRARLPDCDWSGCAIVVGREPEAGLRPTSGNGRRRKLELDRARPGIRSKT